MFQISKWAGRHPTFIRFIVLPFLFYWQCRMAFVMGAELFFNGTVMSVMLLVLMLVINLGVCFAYPFNAKELMHKAYHRLKIMQLVACLSAAGMWGFIGNQTAAYFEHVRVAELGLRPNAGYPFSTLAVTLTPAPLGQSESSMLTTKTIFKKYFKNTIAKIKKSTMMHPKANNSARVLLVILGIILMSFGIVVLVCGIQCGSAAGAVALGVIGGLALIGLGVWALVGGFRRAVRLMQQPVVN